MKRFFLGILCLSSLALVLSVTSGPSLMWQREPIPMPPSSQAQQEKARVPQAPPNVEIRRALDAPEEKVPPLTKAEFMASLQPILDETDPARRLLTLRQLCQGWAQTDLPGTLDWLSSLRFAGDDRRALISELILHEAQSDLPAALALATPELIQKGGPDLAAQLCTLCLAEPSPAGQTWLSQLSQETIFATNMATLRRVASVNPAIAAQWLVAQDVPEGDKEDLTCEVVEAWGRQAPEKASAWVERFPNGPVKEASRSVLRELGIRNLSVP